MSISNLKVELQGLDNLPATLQGATQNAIAEVNLGKFIPNLISDNYLVMLAMAAWQSSTGGTDGITMFDRDKYGKLDNKVDSADVYKDENLGEKLAAKEILAKVDTEYEKRFRIDKSNYRYANPAKVQQLTAEAYRQTMADVIDNLNCDILNNITGRVAKTSDGRDVASKLNVSLNSTLGQATSDEDRVQNYIKIRKIINDITKKFGSTHRFTDIKDFVVFVDLDTYQEFSVALERYNATAITNAITGEVIGRMVNGIKIVPLKYLDNKFDNTLNKINENKVYDFTGIKAAFMHKQSQFVKIWSLMNGDVDMRSGHIFHTLHAGFGVKDGIFRPELCGYITTSATPTIAV